jgi:hypothetical protein
MSNGRNTSALFLDSPAIEVSAAFYGLSVPALTGPCRLRTIVTARYCAIFILFVDEQRSRAEIGLMLNRDQSTVSQALATTFRRRDRDPGFAAALTAIRRLAEARRAAARLATPPPTPGQVVGSAVDEVSITCRKVSVLSGPEAPHDPNTTTDSRANRAQAPTTARSRQIADSFSTDPRHHVTRVLVKC